MSDKILIKALIFPFFMVILIGQMIRFQVFGQSISSVDIYIMYVFLVIFLISFFTIKISKFLLGTLVFISIFLSMSFIFGIMYMISEDIPFNTILTSIYATLRFFFPFILVSYLIKINKNISHKFIIKIFNFLLFLYILHGSFGIIQAFFLPNFAIEYGPDYNWDWQANRLVSTILDPNLASAFYFSILCVLIYAVIHHLIRINWVIYVAIPIVSIAGLLTLSRGGILSFAMVLFVLLLIIIKKDILSFIKSIIVLFAVVVISIVLIQIIFGTEYLFQTDRLGTSNESALNRLTNYRSLMGIFFDQPLLGAGFNYIPSLYSERLVGVSGNYADGGILYLLSSLGLIGIFVFIIFFMVFASTLRNKGLLLVMTLFIMLSSFFTSTMFYPIIMVNMAFMISITEILTRIKVVSCEEGD
jgi:hypothetical protein